MKGGCIYFEVSKIIGIRRLRIVEGIKKVNSEMGVTNDLTLGVDGLRGGKIVFLQRRGQGILKWSSQRIGTSASKRTRWLVSENVNRRKLTRENANLERESEVRRVQTRRD